MWKSSSLQNLNSAVHETCNEIFPTAAANSLGLTCTALIVILGVGDLDVSVTLARPLVWGRSEKLLPQWRVIGPFKQSLCKRLTLSSRCILSCVPVLIRTLTPFSMLISYMHIKHTHDLNQRFVFQINRQINYPMLLACTSKYCKPKNERN